MLNSSEKLKLIRENLFWISIFAIQLLTITHNSYSPMHDAHDDEARCNCLVARLENLEEVAANIDTFPKAIAVFKKL